MFVIHNNHLTVSENADSHSCDDDTTPTIVLGIIAGIAIIALIVVVAILVVFWLRYVAIFLVSMLMIRK